MLLLDILFPARCVGCGRVGVYICAFCCRNVRPISQTEMICPVCERLAVNGRTHPWCRGRYEPDGLISCFRYTAVVRKALKAVKYRYASAVAEMLLAMPPLTSHNFIEEVTRSKDFVLLPVPLSSRRRRERGFNQAEILSTGFGRIFGAPVRTDIIIRRKHTPPQVFMKNRADRLRNMHHAFAVKNRNTVSALRKYTILLVDDVYTTGATIRAAANILKRSGAGMVWGMTMAR